MNRSVAGEADFIKRVQEFQAEAWEELYQVYFAKVYRYLYFQVGDRDVAEDLAAEVFEEACKGIRRFRYRGVPLSSWLYKVARNVMVNWRRRRNRAPRVTVLGEAAQPDHSDRVAARDELARMLDHLTSDQQQVLVLRHIEGHTAASAGEIMGKKENAIRALEFRALASLRRVMSQTKRDGEGT